MRWIRLNYPFQGIEGCRVNVDDLSTVVRQPPTKEPGLRVLRGLTRVTDNGGQDSSELLTIVPHVNPNFCVRGLSTPLDKETHKPRLVAPQQSPKLTEV